MRHRLAPAVLLAIALLGAAALVRAQDAEAPPAAALPVWEYRVLAWEWADSSAVLREVTRNELGDPAELARSLQREHEPVTFGPLLEAVQERLAAKLTAAGREGWEAWWIQEAQVDVGGVLLPAPALYLRRRS